MALVWLEFIAVSGLIVFFGYRLSKYGDVIAEKTGLGRVWVGTILLATVTSLPELFTGFSASAIVKNPDIAIGNALGSCAFNMAMVAVADLASGPAAILVVGMAGVEILAGFSIALIALVSISLLAARLVDTPAFLNIGIYVPVVFAIYLAGVRMAYIYEKRALPSGVEEIAKEYHYEHIMLSTAIKQYALSAAIVILSALALPFVGERIAESTGLGATFVGTIFLALTTTLPEVVVSIAAARIGAIELALANLFGSNMFNVGIIALDDVFYRPGLILGDASINNAITGLFAIVMASLVIAGLNYPRKRMSKTNLSWETATILVLFFINGLVLYFLGTN